MNEKAAGIYTEVTVNTEKMDKGANEAKKKAKQTAEAVNNEFKKVNPFKQMFESNTAMKQIKNMQAMMSKIKPTNLFAGKEKNDGEEKGGESESKSASSAIKNSAIKNYIREAQVAAGIRVYTEDYLRIADDASMAEKKVEDLEKKARELKMQEDYLKENGESEGLSEKYQNAQKSAGDAEKALQKLLKAEEELKANGEDTEFTVEYRDLYSSMESCREKIEELKKTRNDMAKAGYSEKNMTFLDGNSIRNVNDVIRETEQQMQKIVAEMESLEEKGKMLQPTAAAEKLQDKIEAAQERVGKFKTELTNLEAENAKYGTEEWIKNQQAIERNNKALAMYNQEVEKCEQEIKNLESSGNVTEAIGGLANQSIGASVSAVIKQTKEKMKELRESIGTTISQIPVIGRVASEAAFWGSKGFGGMLKIFKSVTPVIQKVSGVFAALVQKFKTGISSLIKSASSFAGKIKSSLSSLNPFGKSLKGIDHSAGSASGPLSKIGGVLKSMVLYRGVSTVLNGAKEGFQNLAQYSDKTNTSLSMLMSSMTQLKNAFAAAFAPLLNVVAPILDAVIQKVISVVNAIGQLFASLTGAGSFVQAKKVQQNYAESLSGSANAAKEANEENRELQRTLLGFDEINKLNEDSNAGSAAAADVPGLSPADMFETVPISGSIKAWADKIKEAWRNADFTEIGSILGNKLNAALAGIPWDTIQGTCNRIAKSVATFLNGFIESTDWTLVGNTLAEGINTAFGMANTFAINFHWESLGNAVGQGINGALGGLDWSTIESTLVNVAFGIAFGLNSAIAALDWTLAGESLSKGINAAADAVYIFSQNFDWSKVGTSLGTGINSAMDGIDWGTIQQSAHNIASGVVGTLNSFLRTTDWNQVGQTIGEYFNTKLEVFHTTVTEFDWNQLGNSIADSINGLFATFDWAKAGQSVSNVAKGILDTLIQAIENTDWSQVGESIKTFVKNIDWVGIVEKIGELFGAACGGLAAMVGSAIGGAFEDAKEYFREKIEECGGSTIKGLKKGITDAWEDAKTWVKEHVADPIVEGFKKALGIHSPSTVMAEQGGYIISGLYQGLTDNVSSVLTWCLELPGNIKEKMGDAKEWLHEKGTDALTGIKNGWESVKESTVGKAAISMGGYVKEKIGDAKEWLHGKGTDALTGIEDGWESAKESTVGQAAMSMSGYVNEKIGDINGAVTQKGRDIMDGLKSGLEASRSVLSSAVSSIPSLITQGIGDMASIGKNAMKSFANGFSSVHIPMPHISIDWKPVSVGSLSFSVPNFGLNWYAKGGFPELGEMFVAREAGPELVGKIGNKNAVANNEQIVSAVSRGVYSAVVSAMSQFQSRQGDGQTPVFNIYVGGRKITDVVIEDINSRTAATGRCPITT